MHLILPKTHPRLGAMFRQFPMFFLAGPILGGGDWHMRMTQLLMKRFDKLIVVNPSRYQHSHPFYKYRMKGAEDRFKRQTDWERHYLEQAADKWPKGCIIFWLACESKDNPRQDGRPYAMDTRGEIGEWRGRMIHQPSLRVVIGAEKNFPGLSQIQRNFKLGLPNFKIYDSMEEVVERATFFVRPSFSPDEQI